MDYKKRKMWRSVANAIHRGRPPNIQLVAVARFLSSSLCGNWFGAF
jgi:hypothetical protein